MKAFRSVTLIAAIVGGAGPALAQIVPVAEAGPYQVMKEESQEVCFAATELSSKAGKLMVYSYYATTQGQRWNVLGYASETELDDGTISITVAIDGTETVSRETQTSGGDFLLPFETLPEIEAHESLVETGNVMAIAIGDVDGVEVPLDDHRIALEAMANCLAGF